MKQPGGTPYPADEMGQDQNSKLSLFLAIGVHAAVVAVAFLSPHLMPRRPLPEIHTVNLFSATEIAPPAPVARPKPAPPSPPQPAPPKPEPPKVVPEPPRTAIPEPAPREIKTLESERIKKEAAPPPPPPEVKKPPVSERPLPPKTANDDTKKRAAEEAKKAEEAARREVQKALAGIRDLYREDPASQPAPPPPSPAPLAEAAAPAAPAPAASASQTERTSPASGGEGVIVEGILRQYLATLSARIQQHWTLPDLQKWDANLEAVMVVKIRRDGRVIENFFERRSTNLHFDQFVEKALRDASPLPPFPPALREERLEIGLRFRPGGVSY